MPKTAGLSSSAIAVDYQCTLSLAASGNTVSVFVGNCKAGSVQFEVASGDAAGTLYIRTKTRSSATAIRLPAPLATKSAGSALQTILPLTTITEPYLDIEYVRTSGGTGQSASTVGCSAATTRTLTWPPGSRRSRPSPSAGCSATCTLPRLSA